MSDPHNVMPGASATHADQQRNPTVAYERADIHPRAIIWFVAALACGIAATLVALVGLFWWFYGDQERQSRSAFPVAEAARQQARESDPDRLLPPPPRLEGLEPLQTGNSRGRVFPTFSNEQHDIGRLRPGMAQTVYAQQERVLTTWQWLDSTHTVARIPIAEAIARLLAKPGDILKARTGAKPFSRGEESLQPGASSSGRVTDGGSK
jgi:hypothetical protein